MIVLDENELIKVSKISDTIYELENKQTGVTIAITVNDYLTIVSTEGKLIGNSFDGRAAVRIVKETSLT